MRWIVGLWVALSSLGVHAAEPKTDGLAELRWLAGEWRGVGEGDPGTSGSERRIDSYGGHGRVGPYRVTTLRGS